MPGKGKEKWPDKVRRYAGIIESTYPQLAGLEVRPVHEEGQYNDALLVGETFIFRFPRYEAGIEMMRREVAFLRAVGGRTRLPIPEPSYANLDSEKLGEIFMGYRLLPGKPLWRPAILGERDERVLDTWAQQLAGFLKELHALPADEFTDGWPASDSVGEWVEIEQLHQAVDIYQKIIKIRCC